MASQQNLNQLAYGLAPTGPSTSASASRPSATDSSFASRRYPLSSNTGNDQCTHEDNNCTEKALVEAVRNRLNPSIETVPANTANSPSMTTPIPPCTELAGEITPGQCPQCAKYIAEITHLRSTTYRALDSSLQSKMYIRKLIFEVLNIPGIDSVEFLRHKLRDWPKEKLISMRDFYDAIDALLGRKIHPRHPEAEDQNQGEEGKHTYNDKKNILDDDNSNKANVRNENENPPKTPLPTQLPHNSSCPSSTQIHQRNEENDYAPDQNGLPILNENTNQEIETQAAEIEAIQTLNSMYLVGNNQHVLDGKKNDNANNEIKVALCNESSATPQRISSTADFYPKSMEPPSTSHRKEPLRFSFPKPGSQFQLPPLHSEYGVGVFKHTAVPDSGRSIVGNDEIEIEKRPRGPEARETKPTLQSKIDKHTRIDVADYMGLGHLSNQQPKPYTNASSVVRFEQAEDPLGISAATKKSAREIGLTNATTTKKTKITTGRANNDVKVKKRLGRPRGSKTVHGRRDITRSKKEKVTVQNQEVIENNEDDTKIELEFITIANEDKGNFKKMNSQKTRDTMKAQKKIETGGSADISSKNKTTECRQGDHGAETNIDNTLICNAEEDFIEKQKGCATTDDRENKVYDGNNEAKESTEIFTMVTDDGKSGRLDENEKLSRNSCRSQSSVSRGQAPRSRRSSWGPDDGIGTSGTQRKRRNSSESDKANSKKVRRSSFESVDIDSDSLPEGVTFVKTKAHRRKRENWTMADNMVFLEVVSEYPLVSEPDLRRKIAEKFKGRRTHEQCANHLRILRMKGQFPASAPTIIQQARAAEKRAREVEMKMKERYTREVSQEYEEKERESTELQLQKLDKVNIEVQGSDTDTVTALYYKKHSTSESQANSQAPLQTKAILQSGAQADIQKSGSTNDQIQEQGKLLSHVKDGNNFSLITGTMREDAKEKDRRTEMVLAKARAQAQELIAKTKANIEAIAQAEIMPKPVAQKDSQAHPNSIAKVQRSTQPLLQPQKERQSGSQTKKGQESQAAIESQWQLQAMK